MLSTGSPPRNRVARSRLTGALHNEAPENLENMPKLYFHVQALGEVGFGYCVLMLLYSSVNLLPRPGTDRTGGASRT